jgi:ribonuclease Z
MSVSVVPLGTASAIPANGRHLSACAVERNGRVLLFDCGEGTQYQIARSDLRASRVDAIFITHFHGDHLYGLPGMVTSLALLGRTAPLTLVGPQGLRAVLEALPGLQRDWLPFPVRYVEVPEGFSHAVVYEGAGWTVEARPLAHRVFTMGFRAVEGPRRGKVDADRAVDLGLDPRQIGWLVRGEPQRAEGGRMVRPEEVIGPERPGAVFAYCLDTAPCEGARLLAQDADLVLHDATFGEDMAERAADTGHSTAREAAETARAAGARRLLLTHFSARYADPDPLVIEARVVFENTEAAEELKRYRVEPVG